jgi:hypothetical protein
MEAYESVTECLSVIDTNYGVAEALRSNACGPCLNDISRILSKVFDKNDVIDHLAAGQSESPTVER